MNISASLTTSYDGLHNLEKGVLSDQLREKIIETLLLVMLPLNTVGIITNCINIRVFAAQGVRNDNTNVGFISLSIFDLLSCITLLPHSFCYIINMAAHDIPQHITCIAFSPQFLCAHVIVQNCSAWTTVYMSLVRSLCVVIPLKVKRIFTPKLTALVIVCIFIFILSIQLGYTLFTKIVWTFDPMFNESYAYIIELPEILDYMYVFTIFFYHVLPISAIVVVSITTSLMVYKLIQVKKWRQKNATFSTNELKDDKSSDKKQQLSSKDIELVKSVTTVTGIFMVCSLMSFIPATATVALPGVSFSGVNYNLYFVVYIARFLFDTINSFINFFFYIRISTRYKITFASLFPSLMSQQAEKET